MPFDFKAYDAKCNGLTPEELQREWEHYTRLISGASTSTAVSGMAIPFTLGVSTIGVAMAAPAIHNARKKRDIIEKHLQKHGMTHVTRKRDVLGSMAVSGTIGIVTLGVGTMGADAVATAGAEHGIAAVVENETAIKVVTHAALDGVGMGIEHAHTSHLKKKDAHKAFQKAGVFQAVQDAKAAEAGYSMQPYNPQTYASGSTTGQALPPPQYAYGSPMSPPPSYSASPGYAYPSDYKSPAVFSASHQVQNYSVPGQPAQAQASQQYTSLPTPYHQHGTAVPTPVGYTPTSTHPLPTPPPYHQAYQSTSWTVPPPPPYPPPAQSAGQVQQQHTPVVQYAPQPGAYDPNGPKNYPTYQQYPQAPAQQQQYQSATPSFQPQYQAQQQVQQQTYNQLATPISPPYGVQGGPQGTSGYFTAMSTAQFQTVYAVPKGSGQPQGQGPYTPLATPGTV
ncbi:hypothetical protein CMUS01_13140 [Colletotrichum musicola]|uniref:Uncharacterized protein n=1 Tax=Colletotrichum musicola TaxID=2175873 RepID=A0A8H6JFQ6_9PEZI|nr:hypothetical protein CMUS01_13140 [Colletotrichum musicola]